MSSTTLPFSDDAIARAQAAFEALAPWLSSVIEPWRAVDRMKASKSERSWTARHQTLLDTALSSEDSAKALSSMALDRKRFNLWEACLLVDAQAGASATQAASRGWLSLEGSSHWSRLDSRWSEENPFSQAPGADPDARRFAGLATSVIQSHVYCKSGISDLDKRVTLSAEHAHLARLGAALIEARGPSMRELAVSGLRMASVIAALRESSCGGSILGAGSRFAQLCEIWGIHDAFMVSAMSHFQQMEAQRLSDRSSQVWAQMAYETFKKDDPVALNGLLWGADKVGMSETLLFGRFESHEIPGSRDNDLPLLARALADRAWNCSRFLLEAGASTGILFYQDECMPETNLLSRLLHDIRSSSSAQERSARLELLGALCDRVMSDVFASEPDLGRARALCAGALSQWTRLGGRSASDPDRSAREAIILELDSRIQRWSPQGAEPSAPLPSKPSPRL